VPELTSRESDILSSMA